MFTFFNELSGVPLNVTDMRAMTPEEIGKLQVQQFQAMQLVVPSLDYMRGLQNYLPAETRSLDERFADFKSRLEAAVAKRY
jgi:hypothetical protein